MKPSADRHERIWAATAAPHARPFVTAEFESSSSPFIAATEAARSASSAAFCKGKRDTRAVYAAPAAAACHDALSGAAGTTWIGV